MPITTTNQPQLLSEALDEYLKAIHRDYSNNYNETEWQKKRAIEFGEDLTYEKGNKYIKVVRGEGSQTSVHSFIVAVDDDPKFKYGDILKAAGWKAPARNKARGNLFTGYTTMWTGAPYL